MKYTRVRSYREHDGSFTGCEHIYARDQVKALEWFRREYPEHDKCILVAEDYDPEDPKNKEHFEACKRCGCVHYW